MGLVGAAIIASPGLAHGQTQDLLYERTVMTTADARCRLFAPEISAALAAAQVQARGAALRAGRSTPDIEGVERRARERALGVDCASPDLSVAANRVRNAFSGFARMERIAYPGEQADWRADRSGPGQIRWRLVQETRFGADRLSFGLAGRAASGVVLAVGQFADGEAPYAARLMMRDARRTQAPYVDAFGSGSGAPLARRLPPRSALRIYAAEARSPAGSDLLPRDASRGWAFRFPAEAARELAALDPREAVAVEFLFDGDVARRAYVEVGDFAAGRAFLTLAGARCAKSAIPPDRIAP
jgi:hypothetical protein